MQMGKDDRAVWHLRYAKLQDGTYDPRRVVCDKKRMRAVCALQNKTGSNQKLIDSKTGGCLYTLRKGGKVAKEWAQCTEEEINKLKNEQCKHCIYFQQAQTEGRSNWLRGRTCDYITITGHSRGCSPFDCKKLGIFADNKKKKRKVSALKGVTIHEG